MENTIIETIGFISKVENVNTVEHNIIPNTLVLEAAEPYPGYHGANLPTDKPPMSIFLITKEEYTFEEILRTAEKVKLLININFNAVYGGLKIFNDNYYSVRLMGLKRFENISTIQEGFEKEGIKFLKSKPVIDCAIIKIHKTFKLKEISKGIYEDINEQDMNYIQIEKKIGWKDFQNVTFSIKNNIENANFDAALGYIFRNSGIIDIVRIYGKNNSIDFIEKLKAAYNKKINALPSY